MDDNSMVQPGDNSLVDSSMGDNSTVPPVDSSIGDYSMGPPGDNSLLPPVNSSMGDNSMVPHVVSSIGDNSMVPPGDNSLLPPVDRSMDDNSMVQPGDNSVVLSASGDNMSASAVQSEAVLLSNFNRVLADLKTAPLTPETKKLVLAAMCGSMSAFI